MPFIAENKRVVIKFARTLFFASMVFYFSYHAVSGEKGLLSMVKLSQQVSSAKADGKQVSEEKAILEHKVNMMYSSSLDMDLLDEQARKMLGRAKKDEVIYFYN